MIKQSLYLNTQPSIFIFDNLTMCHVELNIFASDLGFSVFTEVMMLDDTPGCMTDFVQFDTQVWNTFAI